MDIKTIIELVKKNKGWALYAAGGILFTLGFLIKLGIVSSLFCAGTFLLLGVLPNLD